MSWLDKIRIKAKLIYIVSLTTIRYKMSKSTRDTVLAITKGLAMIAGIFGIAVSPDQINIIAGVVVGIIAIIEMIQGWLSKPDETK